MNILIIEDEELVGNDLEKNIRKLTSSDVKVKQLRSVHESIAYLEQAPPPDLIFSDIQLGDGLSFEVFVAVKLEVPVIFCTAYNEYALDAFKANGIDYILKPFSVETLKASLDKYEKLKKIFSSAQTPQYSALLKLLYSKDSQVAASILVHHLDKIIPVQLNDVAMFYLENEITHMVTFAGKTHYPNKNLDELERLAGSGFFRANRQFLISRQAIRDVSNFFSRKLSVNLTIPFNERVIVSKAKAQSFLNWLAKGV